MATVRLRSDERPWVTLEPRALSGWVERMRGLLGTGPEASPVVLVRCGSVHTFGMRYPIDVALVGERGEVVRVCRSVEPGRFCSHPDASCVIERPSRPGEWIEEGEHLWVVALSADGVGAT